MTIKRAKKLFHYEYTERFLKAQIARLRTGTVLRTTVVTPPYLHSAVSSRTVLLSHSHLHTCAALGNFLDLGPPRCPRLRRESARARERERERERRLHQCDSVVSSGSPSAHYLPTAHCKGRVKPGRCCAAVGPSRPSSITHPEALRRV